MRLADRIGIKDSERLDPQAERELSAVEAGLAGLRVPDDLSDLADLAEALHEERPSIDEEFAAMLDERAARGFSRDGRRAAGVGALFDRIRAVPPRRVVAPVGAAATLLVVAAVGLTTSGVFKGGASSSSSSAPTTPSLGSLSRAHAGNGGNRAAPDANSPTQFKLSAPRASARSEPGLAHVAAPRKVTHNANLTLSTDPDKVRSVADGVTQVTRRYNGFVISSQITSGKGGRSRPVPLSDIAPVGPSLGAEFQLRIPASKLEPALDDLSSLGLVVSRTEGSQDITGRFNSARQRIGSLVSERDALIKQLAQATTPQAVHLLKHRLAVVRHELVRAQGQLSQLHERVRMVPVHVSIVARGAGAGGGGGFGIDDALHDAGRVLTVAAGVLLISLAVLAPLVLIGGLAWLAARSIARWRRERALSEHGI